MYPVFNQTGAQNRRNGARGGRAFARNQHLRKKLAASSPPPAERPAPPPETAHKANFLLDRQFPWLAGAFARKQKHQRSATIVERVSPALQIHEPTTYLPLDS
jgi:hypothetical protein